MQAAATPVEGQRAGLPRRLHSFAALSGVESSGLVTLTESAEDAAGADDAEMEEEVVGALPPMLQTSGSPTACSCSPGACRGLLRMLIACCICYWHNADF